MDCTILTTGPAVAGLVPEWRALWTRHPACNPFHHPAWVTAWWDQRAAAGSHWRCVVGRTGRGELAGVLPLVRTSDGVIRFAGFDLHDVAAALAPCDALTPFWEEALRLVRERDGPGPVELPTIAATDRAAISRAGYRVRESGVDPGAAITLPSSWDSYWAGLSGDARRKIRARRRNLEQRYGPVRLDTVSQHPALAQAVAGLWAMREDAWRRRGQYHQLAAASRGPGWARFLDELAARGASDGLPMVARLMAGDTAVAAALLLAGGGGRVWYYLCTYDPAYAPFGPGVILLTECVRYCLGRGLAVLDLGRGDETYKVTAGAVRFTLADIVLDR